MKRRDVAVILLFNDKKEVLLQHRAGDAERLPGYWAFFGGGIDANETPLEAVKRETLEELGYQLNNPKKIMTQQFEGSDHSGVKHVYIEKYDPSQKLNLSEGQDMKWVALPVAVRMKIVDHDKIVLKFIEDKH
jgi:8-oxo-dGTP diphosphatase